MTEPTAANEHEQHTTTIEITGNGQINAAFENTEGPDGDPSPQTPPPPPNHIQRPMTPPPQVPRPNTPPPQIPTTPQHETPHMNGETPHMNGDTKTNGVEVKTPGSEDNKEVNEAVNLELVNMQPYSNSIPIKKESTELDIGDPYDEYFVPVNQHKKYMRGEKLYVTQDKRRSLGGSKKKCCWGILTVIVLGGIVAILIGVILSSQDSVPVEESRNFNGIKASIGGGLIPTPSPSSTPAPTRPTTDMTEIYLDKVLQGELTIDNLEFTPGLADQNSSEFRNLAASLEEELKSALFDHQTLHYGSADITVKVLEFRSGSVIVVYRVGWEFKDGVKNPPDPIDKDGLKTKLQEHLRSHDGFLYNYRLTLHNLKSERVTDACKIENGGCSQNCMFDRSSLQITCKCEDPYVLHSDGKTCVNPEKSESDSSEEASLSTSEQKHEHGGEHEDGEKPAQGDEHHEHVPGNGDEHHEHVHGHGDEHEHSGKHEHIGKHENDGEHDWEHEHGWEHGHGYGVDNERSTEVYKTTEDQKNENSETDEVELPVVTEHISEHDYHVETELPPEHENFGIKGTSIETYVTPVPEHKQDDITGETSMPSSEQNTQYMYENTNYQPMEESEYKKTSETNGVQESMVEANDSTEAFSRKSTGFVEEQTTEPIPKMKSTDASMNFESSSESKFSSELPTYQGPMNFSEASMESVHSTPLHPYEEMSIDISPETTPMPHFNFESEENADQHHHLKESTEVPVENTNPGEPSSTSPATSSERLAKYNQFTIGGSEGSSYAQTTEKDLMPETTAMPNESRGEQNTIPELNIYQSSENSNYFHSSSEHPISYTELHEDIPTGKIYSGNIEMKSSEFITGQKNENTMTTSSLSFTDTKEEEYSTEVGVTTKKPFNILETGDQSSNISSDHGYISSTGPVEDTKIKQEITTMMPIIQSQEDNQNNSMMTDSTSVLNSSQSPKISSPESKTTYPADELTTQSSQNINDMGSHKNTLNEEEMMPTERTNNDSVTSSEINPTSEKPKSQPMDLMTIDVMTTTPSSLESVTLMPDSSSSPESIVIHPLYTSLNSSNSSNVVTNNEPGKELNQGTTEIPMESDALITSAMSETANNMNLETENNQPTSEPAKSSVEQSDGAPTDGESKIASVEDSDSTVSTFLVGGENMPPIALTPNPDLSGPYSVDSTIQPIPEEEEDIEDVKPVNPHDFGGSTETEGHHQWYDSKNALNSLDDDYNEEEKYANYKLAKGKPEHVTKGYKNIKIDEKSRLPEDSDAVEQTHSHQIEQVPTTTSERSNTETNESLTTIPSPEGPPSKINDEEKLLIKEVYTEATSATTGPNNESEGLIESQPPIQDFNEMRPDGSHEVSMGSIKLMDNHNIDNNDGSVLKEMNNTSTQNMSQTDIDERNNYYAVTENIEPAEVNPTTTGNLHSFGGSTLEETVPRTTMLYESDSPSNNKTECDSEHFACRDGSKCLMKLQQCDSMQDCADGSDEEECEKLNCVENFKCNDGTCLSRHLVCNGIQNCPDGNDEENCDSERKSENKLYITEQPKETETKATESPVEKMELGSTDSMRHSSSGKTDIPANLMEATNIGTEANFMSEETHEAETASLKPVISGTESPISSIEPVMNEKTPDSRSMEFVGGETVTLGVPMETMMNSKVPEHTESPLSSTEGTMDKEAAMSPMESESLRPDPLQKLTDPHIKINETSVPSIETVSSEAPDLSSIMELDPSDQETSLSPMERDKETSLSSTELENSGTELPAMLMETEMRSNESPVTSKEPEMDNTEKPLSSMDSIVGGREALSNFMEPVNNVTEAPVNSMETNMSHNEMPVTTMVPTVRNTNVPSEDASDKIMTTLMPAVEEVSQSSSEMISNMGSVMSSTELSTKSLGNIESSSAEPSTVNTTQPSSNNSTESQADGSSEISSSQITVSSTEPSPTIMESSTSHSENSSKITESASLPTDYMSSSKEPEINSTELPSDLMEQFPIQTALS
ncbi:unnamed protein product [Nezara viridula]|uniref:SEA domain-containing protein n=1 Tax=Nezara viridula TaxID=85310 RepID=A0A9P0MT44_NEZVI|nr:unnamed protein product [Nezara viridula]